METIQSPILWVEGTERRQVLVISLLNMRHLLLLPLLPSYFLYTALIGLDFE